MKKVAAVKMDKEEKEKEGDKEEINKRKKLDYRCDWAFKRRKKKRLWKRIEKITKVVMAGFDEGNGK